MSEQTLQFSYYVLLYILVFALRFLRILLDDRLSWKEDAIPALELAFAFSAVVLFVATRADALETPPWVIGYLVLLVMAVIGELTREKMSPLKRNVLNIGVLFALVGATYYGLGSFSSQDQAESETQTIPAIKWYRVAVPYFDNTLDRHLGGRLSDRYFVHVVEVLASSQGEAHLKAQDCFWGVNKDGCKADTAVIPYKEDAPMTASSVVPVGVPVAEVQR